ncbi:hypothetical protein [Desulfovibrio litoralis]|uniref:Uncharacterized protein n=1 Tax=Desulfovibrio litoralis DSM 11393 TaxID=1121455 RepID=A0A1M7TPU8_9BACT|nr:hypothetical protein [Desulfovibrio litoralis]SHN72759.1 hypothetical protein SAMN02745728_02348 [Desulfovibrio litoralis DSM 11393]
MENINKFISQLSQALPPVIARAHVAELTGGLVSRKTLANEDSLGKGPKDRVRYGQKIAYRREDFIEWLRAKMTSAQNTQHFKNILPKVAKPKTTTSMFRPKI